jgi:midasin (ATPase involved in ribosome maturation)
MITRKVTREVASKVLYEVWNTFVDWLAMEDYGNLDELQRVAHLCFWYDSEVQNGGHLQYFENRGAGLLTETLKALRALGAECQHGGLESAGRQFVSSQRARIATVEPYVSTALEGKVDAFDSA